MEVSDSVFHVPMFLKEMITIYAVVVLEQKKNIISKSVQQSNVINQVLLISRTHFVQGAVLAILMFKQKSGMKERYKVVSDGVFKFKVVDTENSVIMGFGNKGHIVMLVTTAGKDVAEICAEALNRYEEFSKPCRPKQELATSPSKEDKIYIDNRFNEQNKRIDSLISVVSEYRGKNVKLENQMNDFIKNQNRVDEKINKQAEVVGTKSHNIGVLFENNKNMVKNNADLYGNIARLDNQINLITRRLCDLERLHKNR
jgi:hypothetical protein